MAKQQSYSTEYRETSMAETARGVAVGLVLQANEEGSLFVGGYKLGNSQFGLIEVLSDYPLTPEDKLSLLENVEPAVWEDFISAKGSDVMGSKRRFNKMTLDLLEAEDVAEGVFDLLTQNGLCTFPHVEVAMKNPKLRPRASIRVTQEVNDLSSAETTYFDREQVRLLTVALAYEETFDDTYAVLRNRFGFSDSSLFSVEEREAIARHALHAIDYKFAPKSYVTAQEKAHILFELQLGALQINPSNVQLQEFAAQTIIEALPLKKDELLACVLQNSSLDVVRQVIGAFGENYIGKPHFPFDYANQLNLIAPHAVEALIKFEASQELDEFVDKYYLDSPLSNHFNGYRHEVLRPLYAALISGQLSPEKEVAVIEWLSRLFYSIKLGDRADSHLIPYMTDLAIWACTNDSYTERSSLIVGVAKRLIELQKYEEVLRLGKAFEAISSDKEWTMEIIELLHFAQDELSKQKYGITPHQVTRTGATSI